MESGIADGIEIPQGRVHLQARLCLRSVREAGFLPERQMTDETEKGHRSSLYLEVSKRLERKSLAPAPKVVWVSRTHVERTCVVCGRAIRSGQLQKEFIADDGTTAASHTLCLQTWVDVTRALTSADGGRYRALSPKPSY